MKLWGGRFEKVTDGLVDDFHSSISFDQRLYEQDINGSIAHATMLGEQGIISREDAEKIVAGLQGILADARAGKISWRTDAEDIHMNVETLLTERIGEAGKRLHTGRSRNDQVALDTRMYAKIACRETETMLEDLLETILGIAQKNLHTIMPGYTHMQKAQPITLAHHMMAYAQMFLRDRDRFRQAFRAADVMVLGSGALAGTTYPLNRERVAELLDFSTISENSLDGVSDRDYMLDYLAAASICMMHLSRFCEELILWNTNEFRFVEMDDAFATGSSIMPQKKNPDVAELIRGKTGRVYGDLMGLLTVMKGLPLAYNKDMQEDKEAFFDARDTLVKGLTVFTAMLKTVTFRKDVMEKGAAGGFTNATDCADYLVKKGVAFRDAHRVVGALVAHCLNENKALLDLTLEELKQFHSAFEEDVFGDLSLISCVEKREIPGAPAPKSVQRAIDEARKRLGKTQETEGESMIYDYTITTGKGELLNLADYKGKVIMVVNTATGCGFTPQYAPIEQMYKDYHDQGLEILDIPCNQFGGQAPGTDDEIHEFCTMHFNTTFPQMKKADVNGEKELPLYTYLKSQKGFEGFGEHPYKALLEKMFTEADPDWAKKPDIKWNFTKFIIDREGKVVARFEPTADMAEVEACVKALL